MKTRENAKGEFEDCEMLSVRAEEVTPLLLVDLALIAVAPDGK